MKMILVVQNNNSKVEVVLLRTQVLILCKRANDTMRGHMHQLFVEESKFHGTRIFLVMFFESIFTYLRQCQMTLLPF